MPEASVKLDARVTESGVRRGRAGFRRGDNLRGYTFVSPWVIGFLLFGLAPTVLAFYNSFTSATIFKDGKWVGTANYEKLFTTDAVFQTVIGNMLFYVMLSIPLTIGLSLLLALLLRQRFRGNHLFRTIIYIPSLLVGAASGVMFKQIFSGGEFGLANQFLGTFGIEPLNWLNDSDRLWLAMLALVIVNIWLCGSTTIIFLAGLSSISETYYEAARIDGANSRQLFWRITLPLLSPTLVFNTIMVIIGQVQVFDTPLVFARGTAAGFKSGGNPLGYKNNLGTFLTYLYERGFVKGDIGYASAIAIVVFIITLVLALTVLYLARRFSYFGEQEKAAAG